MVYRYRLCKPPGIVRNPLGHLYLVVACCTFVVVSLYLLNELTRPTAGHVGQQRHRNNDRESAAVVQRVKENDVEELVLLIAILSSVSTEGARRRAAVRESWLHLQSPRTAALFFVGGKGYDPRMEVSINEAMNAHTDLIKLRDIPDNYEGLTEKVLGMASWVTSNRRFQYLLKCDDDTFLRPDIIVPELMERESNGPLYMGFMDGRHMPRTKGQWAEKNYVLCDRYIVYAKGGAYVLSASLVAFFSTNMHLLVRFKSEDVSVGTWLAPVDVERKHDPRFDTEYVSRGCDNRFVAMHKQSPDMLRRLYDDHLRLGHQCSVEKKTRGSYAYNWNVPPSQCCNRLPSNDVSIP